MDYLIYYIKILILVIVCKYDNDYIEVKFVVKSVEIIYMLYDWKKKIVVYKYVLI